MAINALEYTIHNLVLCVTIWLYISARFSYTVKHKFGDCNISPLFIYFLIASGANRSEM